MPGRSRRDDGDDRGDDRPALRRADAARDRLERAAGGRGLARAAVRHAAAAHARVRRGRADGAGARAGRVRRRDAAAAAARTGPGKALKLTIAPVQERIPIYIAAIGPKNTTLAAEIADGWLPTLFSPEHVGEFRPLLEEGFARAGGGKGFDDFDIVPTVTAMVTDDLESARDAMRHYVALYVGGMGSRKQNFYNALVQRYGFEDAAREVQDLYLEGKKDEAAAALPGELIDTRRARRPAATSSASGWRSTATPGVGTLMVSPMAWTFEDRLRAAAHGRRAGRLRIFLGAFGDPGHAFPMLALGERAGGARPRGRARDVAALARATPRRPG